MATLGQRIRIALLEPYIRRELPGWGKLYSTFIGGYHADKRWKGIDRRWVRGKLHGYEMLLDIGSWSNRQTIFLKRFYDLPTQLALQTLLKPGDTFVDIGANEGMISLLAARLVGPSGRVIACEPNPLPREILEAAISRNNITNISILPVALGRSEGRLPLYVPLVNSGEASLGSPTYDAPAITIVEVDVANGDNMLADQEPALIKIDVEGFEFEVIQGLASTIERCKPPIIMEVISSHLKRSGATVSDIVGFMRDRGYRPLRLGLRDRRHLRLEEGELQPNAHGDYIWLPLGYAFCNEGK